MLARAQLARSREAQKDIKGAPTVYIDALHLALQQSPKDEPPLRLSQIVQRLSKQLATENP